MCDRPETSNMQVGCVTLGHSLIDSSGCASTQVDRLRRFSLVQIEFLGWTGSKMGCTRTKQNGSLNKFCESIYPNSL